MKKLVVSALLIVQSVWAQQPIHQGISHHIQSNAQKIKEEIEKIFKYDSIAGDPFHTRVYTLPNGLKVYLSPYHVEPRVYTMVAIKAGSKYDPANATGLAHYLEHMLFKGTDKYGTKNYEEEKPLLDKIENLFETYRQTKDEIQRKKIYREIDSISFIAAKYAIANEYDKMVAAIGAQGTNAFTSNDETVYVNDIPSNQIDNWLDIEAERFRNPVFRLFHTELEAVYEEKNRTLDDDETQMYEVLYKELFPEHPYGTQTTIGTIEHLKNPSLKEIKKYYDTYYVPNNMAIILCGDFNPDTVIRKIVARFANKPSKPIPPTKFVSPNLTHRVQKTIYGPKSEMLAIGWKTDGAASRDALYLSVIGKILSNSKSGLIDVNVTGKQKILNSSVYTDVMKDYSLLTIQAEPKQNQSLEEVEKILLEEIHHLRNGEFDEQLIKDIITNKKLELQRILENNILRAYTLLSAFTKDVPLYQIVMELNELKKITKADIIHFAQQYFRDDNYVVVYKKTGENNNIKVTKPNITPVELDRTNTSEFVRSIINSKPQPIQPKFVDFKKDIQSYTLNIPTSNGSRSIQLLYNHNKENELFELTYYYLLDDENIKTYEIIFDYLNDFPATQSANTQQTFKQLYQLGCDIKFRIYKMNNAAYITVSGLSENINKAIHIMEDILKHPFIDDTVWKEFVNDLIKQREDEKKEKNIILRKLNAYAVYGEKNIYSNVLNNEELQKLTTSGLVKLIQTLNQYPHQVLFYGTTPKDELIQTLQKNHYTPPNVINVSDKATYSTSNLNKGKYVFYTPYTMQQAELQINTHVSNFDSKLIPIIELFNEYFGTNMSSVVFQEIREARALAYAAVSVINKPTNKNYPFINSSYIGTQADKLKEALEAMYQILDSIPYNKTSYEAAKEGIIQRIRTERIIKTDMLLYYLYIKRLGLDYDIRKDIFEQVQKMNFQDLWKFHKKYISNKPKNIAIIGDENKLNFDVLKQYGTLQKVSLKDIFGY